MKDVTSNDEVPMAANLAIEGLSAALYIGVGATALAAARHGYLAVEGVFNSAENVNALIDLFKMGFFGGLARLGVYGLHYIGAYQEELPNGLGNAGPTHPDQG